MSIISEYGPRRKTLALILVTVSLSLSAQLTLDTLTLSDTGKKIENVIELTLSKSDYEAVKATPGVKARITPLFLTVTGDTLKTDEACTRGQSTMLMRRKSFGFKVHPGAEFIHNDKSESLSKFYLMSLSLDRYYCHNRLAFEMMDKIKLFNLFYAYCELKINGESQGICLILERPEDWAIRKKDSPMLIRRGYEHNINKIVADEDADRETVRKYSSRFRQIYSLINRYSGEDLYLKLSECIDVENYLKWIAFNLLVRNGDYSDEVFFYIDSKTDRFKVIPWDYDDIFAFSPHEGNVENRKIVGNRLFFSTEDLLDRKIVEDQFLYCMFLDQLRGIIDKLTPAYVGKVFETTFAELYPYYTTPAIISNSLLDAHADASVENLKKDMQALYRIVLVSRIRFLERMGVSQ